MFSEPDAIARPSQFPEPTVEIPLLLESTSASDETVELAVQPTVPIARGPIAREPVPAAPIPAAPIPTAPIPAGSTHAGAIPTPPISPRPTAVRGPVTPQAPDHPPVIGRGVIAFSANRRRWPLPSQLVVLMLVIAASGVFGYAGYRTVAGVGLSESGWAQVAGWSWGLLFGAVATLVVAILSVVTVIRTQASRLVAVISLIVALLLPPIALYAGGRLGFDVAAASVSSDIASLTSEGFGGMLLDWVMSLFGE